LPGDRQNPTQLTDPAVSGVVDRTNLSGGDSGFGAMTDTNGPGLAPGPSAFRVRIATNGSARRVMRLPKIEMVAAAQMRWKAPLRHKVGVGS